MIINKTDISKISLGEALSNSNGKTSGTKIGGIIGLAVGAIGFIMNNIALFVKSGESLGYVVAMAGISAGVIAGAYTVLGYSKYKATKDTTNTEQ